jgi:HlyD family secretion protein
MALTDWIKRTWNGSRLGRTMLVAPPIALVVLSIVWTYTNSSDVQYYTAKVDHGSITQVVQSAGTINPFVTVSVGAQVTGLILANYVDFNTDVKKGQLVSQIDPTPYQAKLDQAEATIANSKANVAALTAAVETQKGDIEVSKAGLLKAQSAEFDSKTQWDRTLPLAQQGVLSSQQRDDAKAAYDQAVAATGVAKATLDESNAKLISAQAALDQARAMVNANVAAAESNRLDLEHCKIYSPVDGTVISRIADVGQTIVSGLQASTLFTIAEDLNHMYVYSKTDESDEGSVQVGTPANFRVDAYPREIFPGTIKQKRMSAYTVQNVVTYDTIIEFDNPDRKLFPGMTAYVTVPVASETNVTRVPNGALRFKPDMSDADLKAVYAKYNIPTETAAPAARPAGGGAPGGGGGGVGRGQGGGGGGRGQGGGRGATSTVVNTGTVWKLEGGKTLVPVRVNLGVTDFTFTALHGGDLKPGDDLVIGEISKATAGTAAGRSPLGGAPAGVGRKF